MKKNELISVFETAKQGNCNYVGVAIHMDRFPAEEVIINKSENFDAKLKYYLSAYDDHLKHKKATGIYITKAQAAYGLLDLSSLF